MLVFNTAPGAALQPSRRTRPLRKATGSLQSDWRVVLGEHKRWKLLEIQLRLHTTGRALYRRLGGRPPCQGAISSCFLKTLDISWQATTCGGFVERGD